MTPSNLMDRVLDVFALIEADTAAFKLASGLRCPAGCGACCRSARVRTTILEMLPAAAEILRSDDSEHWLAATDIAAGSACCAAYSPARLDPAGGHCRLYRWRPSVCRLFGFAAAIDRRGRPALAACKIMKAGMPQKVDCTAEALSGGGMQAPILSGYSMRLAALEPVLGARLMPINQALHQAIRRLGLGRQFDPTSGAGGAASRIAA